MVPSAGWAWAPSHRRDDVPGAVERSPSTLCPGRGSCTSIQRPGRDPGHAGPAASPAIAGRFSEHGSDQRPSFSSGLQADTPTIPPYGCGTQTSRCATARRDADVGLAVRRARFLTDTGRRPPEPPNVIDRPDSRARTLLRDPLSRPPTESARLPVLPRPPPLARAAAGRHAHRPVRPTDCPHHQPSTIRPVRRARARTRREPSDPVRSQRRTGLPGFTGNRPRAAQPQR